MNFSSLNKILNWSTPAGRIFGIPIRLHISLAFFLLPALTDRGLGIVFSVEYALGIVLSILLHELGHALSAKKYGLTGLSIMLHGFGGFAVSSGYRTPKQALVITLAGPAVTFLLGFTLLGIGSVGAHSQTVSDAAFQQFGLIRYLGMINLLMGVLNLIPSLPFDGGRALEAILSYRLSEHKAVRAVGHLGLILTPIVFFYGIWVNQNFVSIFGAIGFIASVQVLQSTGGIRFGEVFQDRKHRKEMVAVKLREQARTREYLDDVTAREIKRKETERLRKLLGED